MKLSLIYLYNGVNSENFRIDKVWDYIIKKFPHTEVIIRDEFINFWISKIVEPVPKEIIINKISKELVRAKVQSLTQKIELEIQDSFVFSVEIDYEKERMLQPHKKYAGAIYDGFELVSILKELVSQEEGNLKICHIILTERFIATYSEDDLRYHLRTSVYSTPSIISTGDLVEAPAKPREYYIKKQLGFDEITLKKEFAGKFLDYNDFRLTDVVVGYVMQAIFYHITGNPFCEDKNCRLYNSHWQQEMIHCQLQSEYEFCKFHEGILNEFR